MGRLRRESGPSSWLTTILGRVRWGEGWKAIDGTRTTVNRCYPIINLIATRVGGRLLTGVRALVLNLALAKILLHIMLAAIEHVDCRIICHNGTLLLECAVHCGCIDGRKMRRERAAHRVVLCGSRAGTGTHPETGAVSRTRN